MIIHRLSRAEIIALKVHLCKRPFQPRSRSSTAGYPGVLTSHSAWTSTLVPASYQRHDMIRIPLSISIDATNAAQVADAAKQVVSVFGRLDVVVNNAGYMETFKSIIDSDPEE